MTTTMRVDHTSQVDLDALPAPRRTDREHLAGRQVVVDAKSPARRRSLLRTTPCSSCHTIHAGECP